MGSHEVPRAAGFQGLIFTVEQALADGWSQRQVKRRMEAGRWVRVAGRGLAARSARPWTSFQLGWAARLSVPDATVSHQTAGLLHGFPLADRPDAARDAHAIATGRHRGGRNLVIHRIRLTDAETCLVGGGLRITGLQRTAIDVLSTSSPDQAMDLWAWLTTRKVLSLPDLESAVAQRHGWYGVGNLRRLSDAVSGGAVSPAEALLHSILERAGISGWEAGVTISDRNGVIGVVDLLFAGRRLVVEVDGWRAHSSQESFFKDRRRQNRLVNAGYTVLRYTWKDLTERPDQVAREIAKALMP